VTYALGIDIGTTFSAAAVWRDGRAETVPLGNRANVVPSVVLLRDDGTLLVGDAAARRAIVEPRRVAREFKRRVGDRVPVMLGEQPVEPERLLAAMVAWIVERVSEREDGTPAYVTLTCPANWGEYRRGLLRDAALDAGLVNAGLVVEPVAAAIHYASQERVEPGAFIGVYDLGGGTFDATVLRKTDEGFEVYGTPEGDDGLGGVDFDQLVLAHVAASLGDTWSKLDLTDTATLQALAQVRANAVEAKEALSTDVEAGIAVILPGVTQDVRITRSEFEDAVRATLQRTIDVFRQAVVGGGLEPSQLHRVLLVGGSSRIPLVSQLLTQQLGVQIAVDAHPKYAVCLGAAVAAGTRLAAAAGVPQTLDMRAAGARDEADQGQPGATRAWVADERDDQEAQQQVASARPEVPVDKRVLESLRAPVEGAVPHAETQEFAAIVGDSPAQASGERQTLEVDLVDRGLTAAHDVSFSDVTHAIPPVEREEPPPPKRVERGRKRQPVITAVLVALVVLSGAAAMWAVTEWLSQRNQQADPPVVENGGGGNGGGDNQPPAGSSAPPTTVNEAAQDQVGRFDFDGLDLTEVSPQDLGGIDVTDDNQIEGITTSGTSFVAVGDRPSDTELDALVLLSPDGQEWSRFDDPAFGGEGNQRMFSVASGPGGVIGVGVDGTRPEGDGGVWTGLDDEVTKVESPALGSEGYQEIRDIVWYQDRYIAVGCSDTTGEGQDMCAENQAGGQEATIWTSTDGLEWSRLDSGAVEQATNAVMWAVTPTTAGVAAVGIEQDAGPESRRAAFWFSADGETWSRVEAEPAPDSIDSSITGVAANELGVVATGYDSTPESAHDEAFWFSADGTSWEQAIADSRTRNNQVVNKVVATPDGFLAVGRDFQQGSNLGGVWVSPDGQQWNRQYEDVFGPDGTILRDAAASTERLVIAGHGTGDGPLGVRLLAADAAGDP
jgi:molecular chaperone DnaK (HSP70)